MFASIGNAFGALCIAAIAPLVQADQPVHCKYPNKCALSYPCNRSDF